MDNFLADLYGTNASEESFEKVAHLDFLEKVAEEEGIDLNDLSDEDIQELAEMAAEALDEETDYEEEGYEEDVDDLEKEAEAKVEEADFLGRVMAHSFTQEMDNIEKDAGARMEAAKSSLKRGYGAAKSMGAEAMGRGRRAGAQAYGEKMKALKKSPLGRLGESSTMKGRMKQRLQAAGSKIDATARGLGRRLGAKSQMAGAMQGAKDTGYSVKGGTLKSKIKDVATHGPGRRMMGGAAAGRKAAIKSQRRRGYGAMGAGLAGLGAAGAGAAYAGREKKSADEQWEEAVQARAWEHLMAAGLADDNGNFIPAEDFGKTSSDAELEYQLDADALELLESEGYPVEWY